MDFRYQSYQQRVSFSRGSGIRDLRSAAERLSATRLALIASPSAAAWAERAVDGLNVVIRVSEVTVHVPADVADRARAAIAGETADAIVAVGGGSAIGLAKAVALTSGLPIVAVPTTYSGSEITPVWGITEAGRKRTGQDLRVVPREVVYDVELTERLPPGMTVESALNGLAHCIDGLWSPTANPIDDALAGEGIRQLFTGLRQIDRDTIPRSARESLLFGGFLAGSVLAGAGTGIHHKICHVIGGATGLPHAALHAVVLPFVIAFNVPFAPGAAKRIAASIEDRDITGSFEDLYHRVQAPRSLRQLGAAEADVAALAEDVLAAIPPSNPRPVDLDSVRGLLAAAWAGSPWENVN